MDDALWTTFPALSSLGGFAHRFTLRHPGIDVDAEREVVVKRLWAWHRSQAEELGFPSASLCIAEQVHGREVAVVNAPQSEIVAGIDGLYIAVTVCIYPNRGGQSIRAAGRPGRACLDRRYQGAGVCIDHIQIGLVIAGIVIPIANQHGVNAIDLDNTWVGIGKPHIGIARARRTVNRGGRNFPQDIARGAGFASGRNF